MRRGIVVRVTKKSGRISAMIDAYRGRELDAHYLGYFFCFNCQLFFEAHDVLEELWLSRRQGPDDSFYKGLIQLAGAFVHLQKNRLRPAAALFKLARTNLELYPPVHHQLNVRQTSQLIDHWQQALAAGGYDLNPFRDET